MMDCPKCGDPMELKHFGAHYAVNRCSNCRGIWCNAAQISDLESVPMLDVLDVGDAVRGAVYDQIKDIDCPECGARMERQSVPRQPHIDIEVCPGCAGVFLDAGELTDAKHFTVGDWLKALKVKLALE